MKVRSPWTVSYTAALMAGLLGLPLALAEDSSSEAAMEAAPSSRLLAFRFTDEQIEERCAAAIRSRAEMVAAPTEEDPHRKVPRCVAVLETLRQATDQYMGRESEGKVEIGREASQCLENATQANCLAAGGAVAAKAQETHERLAQTAEEGESKISAHLQANAPPAVR